MRFKKLPKTYQPRGIEDKIYRLWEQSGFFNPDKALQKKGQKKQYFSIMMPPPNVTGRLHLGHAMMLAIEDLLIRWKRMQGAQALWVPGADHAAIATQSVVEKDLLAKGLTRQKLGREKFLEKVTAFAGKSKKVIRNQIKKMGASCDWSREAYTLDSIRTEAVQEVFQKMFQDGLIYRGERIVNWCPRCQSTLADDEVEYAEQPGKLYYLKYFFKEPDPFVLKVKKQFADKEIEVVIEHPQGVAPWTGAVPYNHDRAYYPDLKNPYRQHEIDVIVLGYGGKVRTEEKVKVIVKGILLRADGNYKLICVKPDVQITKEMLNDILTFYQRFFYGTQVKLFEQDADFRDFLEIATTRPETLFGDTAVAIHPDDQRYKHLIGREVILPLKEKILKVVSDTGVSIDFGTGVLKITPGHDALDFEIGQRQKLPIRNILNPDGTLNKETGNLAGLPVIAARQKTVAELQKQGLIAQIKDYPHPLGFCYRCDTAIEPLVSLQWFVSVDKPFLIKQPHLQKIFGKKETTLKEIAIWAVESKRVKIIPERFCKTYFQWMKNLRDWCISRQIWFGHRIPVWYKSKKEEIYVGTKPPGDINEWQQDEDTLDTWFSSGLWTFSGLNWPQQTGDLKRFHPTSVLETGYDIIFFWVARMIIMTLYCLGEIPFRTVYLHGLVRDKEGRKMSKSLGNIIDPLDIIAKVGADAVRLSLVIGTAPGNDSRLYQEKIAGFRNFTNKLWNIGRYVLQNLPAKSRGQKIIPKKLTLTEQWILSRLQGIIALTDKDFSNYRFSQAGERLRDFTWGEFADWYLEIHKLQPNAMVLEYIFSALLRLWHPFMPYVTEYLYQLRFPKKGLLMTAEWPPVERKFINSQAEKQFQIIQKVITKIRNIRADYKIPFSSKLSAVIVTPQQKAIKSMMPIMQHLAGLSAAQVSKKAKKSEGAIALIADKCIIYLLLKDIIQAEQETERITKEIKEGESYLAVLLKRLRNKEFLKKAPADLVAQERVKKTELQKRLKELQRQLKDLAKF